MLNEIEDIYLADISYVIEDADVHDRANVHCRVALVLQYMEDNTKVGESSMLMDARCLKEVTSECQIWKKDCSCSPFLYLSFISRF